MLSYRRLWFLRSLVLFSCLIVGASAASSQGGLSARGTLNANGCFQDPVAREGPEKSPQGTADIPGKGRQCEAVRVANDAERRRMQRYIVQLVEPKDVVASIQLSAFEVV